jgi:hypothetical protein
MATLQRMDKTALGSEDMMTINMKETGKKIRNMEMAR